MTKIERSMRSTMREMIKYREELKKENAELKTELENKCKECVACFNKENKKLKAELEKWKTEWQEQVVKANDEGYARTLQGIEIEKLKAQIGKMKCCANCDNGLRNGLLCDRQIECRKNNYKLWELANDRI